MTIDSIDRNWRLTCGEMRKVWWLCTQLASVALNPEVVCRIINSFLGVCFLGHPFRVGGGEGKPWTPLIFAGSIPDFDTHTRSLDGHLSTVLALAPASLPMAVFSSAQHAISC